MTDKTDRKATDILLDLETKVDRMLAYIATIDMNHKLLLNRLNSGQAKFQDPHSSQTNLVEVKPKDVEYEFKNADETIAEDPMDDNSAAPELEVDKNPNGKKRNTRSHTTGKMVPVQQKICYPDGSNVCVAKVEVCDLQGNLVKQMRTNQVGKWMMSLTPGDYNVTIVKMQSTNKPKVDLKYQITIPYSDSIVELQVKKLT